MGKYHKVFLGKPKTIRVELHENKEKTFLADRKRSKLDEMMKLKTVAVDA